MKIPLYHHFSSHFCIFAFVIYGKIYALRHSSVLRTILPSKVNKERNHVRLPLTSPWKLCATSTSSDPEYGDAALVDNTFEELFGEMTSVCHQSEGNNGDGEDPAVVVRKNENKHGSYGLPSWLTNRASELGYTNPTLIQQRALRAILNNDDVIIHAQTGSGKTLAYLLPLLSLVDASRAAVQGLIVVPTRELGLQVSRVAKRLAAGSGRHTAARGKIMIMSVLQGSQNKRQRAWAWAEPPHICVGTPEELTKMVKYGGIRYNAVKYVVVDEVDACLLKESSSSPLHILLSRYLSPTFANEFDAILQEQHLTSSVAAAYGIATTTAGSSDARSHVISHGNDRQTVFVSATIPQHNYFRKQCVKNQWVVREPIHICASPGELMPPGLKHSYIVCDSMVSKLGGLRRFLKKEFEVGKLKRVLIFCDSDRPMEEMAQVLSKDLNGLVCREGWETSPNDTNFKDDITTLVSILRLEASLSARASAMAIFQDTVQLENDQTNKICEKIVPESVVDMKNSNNKVRILFCNDLAARGLDITDVSHVINFDMPKDSDSYIHRGGRAGRLGRPGFVVTLIISSQEFILERLANKIGLSIRCISRQKPIP